MKRTATLIPYEHWEWGITKRVWVDKENMHPDPMKKMIWGFDSCGETFPGDFKGRFTRIGEPIKIPYDTTGALTASDERKRKLNAIRSYIHSLNECKRS